MYFILVLAVSLPSNYKFNDRFHCRRRRRVFPRHAGSFLLYFFDSISEIIKVNI